MKTIYTIIVCFIVSVNTYLQAQSTPIFDQFVQAKADGTEPTLPDFSYAGYNCSETGLPDIGDWPIFDVTSFGATANDGNYDDAEVQAAIDAAEANGKGIVFFPPGKFLFSPTSYKTTISVNGSNIVMKGSGAGPGGTELYVEKENPGEWKFEFRPTGSLYGTQGTKITSEAKRETFELEVANASNLQEGQRIVLRSKNAEDFSHDYFDNRDLLGAWTLLGNNFFLTEIHTIKSICGNKVTLAEPLHITLKPSLADFYIYTFNHIEEVGIEDIKFTGGWLNFPEVFKHHKNSTHNYGWQGVRLRNVYNAWVKNCVFHSWSRAISVNGGAMVTLDSLLFNGKEGHFGPSTSGTYGVLIKNSEDQGSHHGPSMAQFCTGTVYKNYQLSGDHQIDTHGSCPYSNLYDNVRDGYMFNNGGAIPNLPNHGRHLVFWNFKVDGGPSDYNFWLDSMPGNTGRHFYADPIFVGLYGDPITLQNAGVNESQNTPVQPSSLFDSQLDLRLNAADFDLDRIPDTIDEDDDNDGILDITEGTADLDKDGMPNHQDLDSDNDNCFDAIEGDGNYTLGDLTDYGAIDLPVNAKGLFCGSSQLIGNSQNESEVDCCTQYGIDEDGDGIRYFCDLDDDNDGILNRDEMSCGPDTEFTFLGYSHLNKVAQWSVSNGLYSGTFTAITDKPSGPWLSQAPKNINFLRIKFEESSQGIHTYYQGDEILGAVLMKLKSISSTTKVILTGENEVVENSGMFGLNSISNTLAIGAIFPTNPGDALRDDNSGELLFEIKRFNSTGHYFKIVNQASPYTGLAEYHFKLKTDCDTDSDNVPNHLDLDSDNDGCPDAIEGGNAYYSNSLTNDALCIHASCVNTDGVPTILDANSATVPQSIGLSQDHLNQPDDDGDGISACDDVCPNFDDTLIGTPCDDNNPGTTNDTYTTNCLCEGISTPQVTHFELVDANADSILRILNSGDTIDLTTDGDQLNMLALVSDVVGSIRFDYDGVVNYRIENVAPYSFEDMIAGDYQPWTPTLGAHTLTANAFSAVGATGTLLNSITINFHVVRSIPLDIRVCLEGPIDPTTQMMTGSLHQLNLLPSVQPYGLAPWNYFGTEGQGWSSNEYPSNAIDWVKVSFRTDIFKSTEVVATAAVLLSNGKLWFPNPRILLSSMGSSFYIVIQHRNHMGVLSPLAVSMLNDELTYDFCLENSYQLGAGQKEIVPGLWAMYAGDGNQIDDINGYDINGLDHAGWNMQNGQFSIYSLFDYNFDGDVNGMDKILWNVNNGVYSQVEK